MATLRLIIPGFCAKNACLERRRGMINAHGFACCRNKRSLSASLSILKVVPSVLTFQRTASSRLVLDSTHHTASF